MWPTGCGLPTAAVSHNLSTRPGTLRGQEVLGWLHGGQQDLGAFGDGDQKCLSLAVRLWGSRQGHGWFSDGASILALPGILGLNSSERQALDLQKECQDARLSLSETLVVSRLVQGGQGWPCQFWRQR